jgi:hypothetical protein
MAGDIKISEDRSWMVAGWVFRNVIEDTLPFIPKEFSRRLLQEIEKGFGEGKLEFIDLSRAPLAEKRTFLDALREALIKREEQGSEAFNDPDFYSGYIERFKELIEMVVAAVSEMQSKEYR